MLDPDGFIEEFGQRPMVHLDELGILQPDVCMTHCVQVDDTEVGLIAKNGSSVAHCPTTALKVSYGVTQVGKMPEMVQQGINVSIGTDGNNASNYSDMMRATYLVAGLFKDARQDPQMFPAEMAYEMATLGGAKSMGMEDSIGSLEVGKKADVVVHDTDRPEWRPLLNVMNQLVWSADGRGVHTVVVDGIQIEQVTLNLIRNSIEALTVARAQPKEPGEKGSVENIFVRTRVSGPAQDGERELDEPEAWVTVTVEDTGPGVQEAVAARMFEPFFTAGGKGIGLGLTISRSIVESHGGRLWFAPGKDGAAFHFTLPVRSAPIAE